MASTAGPISAATFSGDADASGSTRTIWRTMKRPTTMAPSSSARSRASGPPIVTLLYRSDDGFARNEAHAWRRVVAPIVGGAAELRFGDVPPGAYAVFAFHDENGNGTLERSFLGAPKHQQANEILNLSTVYL
jgi:Uncharacterized protein conserved in bacteria (DUF2141)